MNPQTQPRTRDPAAIFSDMGQASAPPTAAQQAGATRAHTEVVSASGELVTDNPDAMVEAVVKPHHNYGGVPAGMTVRLPFREFDGNRAALCSKAEYARITALEASPGHQALQAQLAAMRAAQTDAFRRGLTADKIAELEAAQRKARDDDQKEDTLRRQVAQAAAETRPQPAPPPASAAIPTTAEALEALIVQRRAATEQAAAGATPRGKERMRQLMDEEELELRQAFLAAQEQQRAAATAAQERAQMTPAAQRPAPEEVLGIGLEERLARLADLRAKGLIDEEVCRQRQAEIVAEV